MNRIDASVFSNLDELRLMALGRIPRCAGCPRYRALDSAFRSRGGGRGPQPLPPANCTYRVCAPLAARWWGASGEETLLATTLTYRPRVAAVGTGSVLPSGERPGRTEREGRTG